MSIAPATAAPAVPEPGPWVSLVSDIGSGFSDNDGSGTRYNVSYRLMGDDTAELRGGLLKGGGPAGAVSIALPAEARPAREVRASIYAFDSSSSTAVSGFVTIAANGDLVVGFAVDPVPAFASGDAFHLDGVRYSLVL